MKETVWSLRVYFIAIAIYDGMTSIPFLTEDPSNRIFLFVGVMGFVFSCGSLYVGIRFKLLLVKSPQFIRRFILANVANQMLDALLALWYGFYLSSGYLFIIGIAIAWYLLKHVQRLSQEEAFRVR